MKSSDFVATYLSVTLTQRFEANIVFECLSALRFNKLGLMFESSLKLVPLAHEVSQTLHCPDLSWKQTDGSFLGARRVVHVFFPHADTQREDVMIQGWSSIGTLLFLTHCMWEEERKLMIAFHSVHHFYRFIDTMFAVYVQKHQRTSAR